jgi:hypothetical protein
VIRRRRRRRRSKSFLGGLGVEPGEPLVERHREQREARRRDYSVCLNLTQFRGVEGCKLWVPMEVVMVEVVVDEASRDAHRETTTEVSV